MVDHLGASRYDGAEGFRTHDRSIIPTARLAHGRRLYRVVMDTTFLAWFAAVLFGCIAALQFALAAGAPLGHVVYGGRKALPDNRLPRPLRIASAFAGLVLLGFAWIVLARAGVVSTAFSDMAIKVAAWIVVVYMAFNTAANLMGEHWFERWVLGGVTAVLVVVCAIVAAAGPS